MSYPPGVTGNEFAINGPDFEHTTQRFCPGCERVQTGVLCGYRRERWFVCDECCETTELDTDDR